MSDVDAAVQKIMSDMQAYSDDLVPHCERVCALSQKIGKSLKLNDNDLTDLYYAALIHDYGKIKIPKEILLHPGRLEFEELKIVRQHVCIGCEMIRDFHCFSNSVIDLVEKHHERLNGSGYPNGVHNTTVTGNIIAVCDVFDAMTNKRCYHEALSAAYAKKFLDSGRDIEFIGRIIDEIKKIQ